MNEMDLLSTPHSVAQKSTKTRYKVAPKAAPDLSAQMLRIYDPMCVA
jgi:hypothetical protein